MVLEKTRREFSLLFIRLCVFAFEKGKDLHVIEGIVEEETFS
jgi:hypothetical protein